MKRRSKELIGDRVVIGDGQFYPTNNKPLKTNELI
jgi:hypothetical protein